MKRPYKMLPIYLLTNEGQLKKENGEPTVFEDQELHFAQTFMDTISLIYIDDDFKQSGKPATCLEYGGGAVFTSLTPDEIRAKPVKYEEL